MCVTPLLMKRGETHLRGERAGPAIRNPSIEALKTLQPVNLPSKKIMLTHVDRFPLKKLTIYQMFGSTFQLLVLWRVWGGGGTILLKLYVVSFTILFPEWQLCTLYCWCFKVVAHYDTCICKTSFWNLKRNELFAVWNDGSWCKTINLSNLQLQYCKVFLKNEHIFS